MHLQQDIGPGMRASAVAAEGSLASLLGRIGRAVSAAAPMPEAARPDRDVPPTPGDAADRNPPAGLRSDLRQPSGAYSPDPRGQDMMVEITLLDETGAPLVGRAVDLWHCDAAGRAEDDDVPDGSWLRGMGVSDQSGTVRFATVVPGCIAGHVPHLWLEVFDNVEAAQAGEAARLSTMVLLPWKTCAHIYAADLSNTFGTENLNRLLLTSEVGLGGAAPDAPQLSMIGTVAEGYFGQLALRVGTRAEAGKPRAAGLG